MSSSLRTKVNMAKVVFVELKSYQGLKKYKYAHKSTLALSSVLLSTLVYEMVFLSHI